MCLYVVIVLHEEWRRSVEDSINSLYGLVKAFLPSSDQASQSLSLAPFSSQRNPTFSAGFCLERKRYTTLNNWFTNIYAWFTFLLFIGYWKGSWQSPGSQMVALGVALFKQRLHKVSHLKPVPPVTHYSGISLAISLTRWLCSWLVMHAFSIALIWWFLLLWKTNICHMPFMRI